MTLHLTTFEGDGPANTPISALSEGATAGWDITHLDFLGSDMHDDGKGAVTWFLDDIVLVGPTCD